MIGKCGVFVLSVWERLLPVNMRHNARFQPSAISTRARMARSVSSSSATTTVVVWTSTRARTATKVGQVFHLGQTVNNTINYKSPPSPHLTIRQKPYSPVAPGF